MRGKNNSLNTFCRSIVKVLGLGTVGAMTVLATVTAPDKVFAKQFVSEHTSVKLPGMVYDKHLQMMVDLKTLLPIYEDAKKLQIASGLPTITAGCSDCPKKDDDGS